MNNRNLMKLVLDRHSEADNALGLALAKATGKRPDDPMSADILIMVATAHIMAARALLKEAMGPAGASMVFYQHADGLATEASGKK